MRTSHRPKKRSILLLAIVAFVVSGVVGVAGWRWRASVICHEVVVTGERQAPTERIRELAAVSTDTLLYTIDPVDVAIRVERDPWVERAIVKRTATGKLRIGVKERVPVAVVLQEGEATHYLDRNGFQMPFESTYPVDVPIIRGVTDPYEPIEPVTDDLLLEMLTTLDRLDASVNAIVSEIVLANNEVSVFTTPLQGQPSIEVRMGGARFYERFQSLGAFWTDVVLRSDAPPIRTIELRYDSQIITT